MEGRRIPPDEAGTQKNDGLGTGLHSAISIYEHTLKAVQVSWGVKLECHHFALTLLASFLQRHFYSKINQEIMILKRRGEYNEARSHLLGSVIRQAENSEDPD